MWADVPLTKKDLKYYVKNAQKGSLIVCSPFSNQVMNALEILADAYAYPNGTKEMADAVYDACEKPKPDDWFLSQD